MRWWAVLLLVVAAGCLRTNYNLATDQEEVTFTPTEKEVEVGRVLARQVERELELVPDEPMQERVRALGQRLAAVCDRKELIYSFAVIKEDDVNAFSLPGGYVFVNEGLVKNAANDDELASVLAHEIAHITARHAVKRYESSMGLQLLQLASLAGRQGQAVQGVRIAVQAAQLSYARQDELDADRLGVRYMKAAGFDPTAVLAFLQKLQGIDRKRLGYLPRGIVKPVYARSHPFVPDRLRAVKEELYGVADYVDYLNAPTD